MSAEDGITANVYREHRFDWDAAGVKFFLDGKQRHEDRRTPALGGNLQVCNSTGANYFLSVY